jgi:ADP-heptose:LPS heptosyltransferase
MSRTPVKYTPKYIISEAIKWTEYGLQQGLIRLLRWVLPRRKASLHQVDFRTAKVLFLRQNQIGDALISTPIFAALKRHYPAMTIDVLLDRRNAVALEANPHIRKRYIIKQKKLDILSAIHSIRKERYDIVVDLVHSASSTSTLICLCCNAKVIMGFERPNDFLYDEKVKMPTDKRMMRQLAEILRLFQLNPDEEPLLPCFHVPDTAHAFAEKVIKKVCTAPEQAVIGINISASTKTFKFWGTQNFIELVKHLRTKRPDAALLILYAKNYCEIAQEIAKQSGAALCDETKTLADFAAIISRLHILITPDSAAVHLADIWRVPMLILTHLPQGETAWYPTFAPFQALHAHNGTVASITLQEVIAASEALLENVLLSPKT